MHLTNIYNMPDAVLSTVATMVKETEPVHTELCGGWMGLQGSRGEETDLFMVYQLTCVPVHLFHRWKPVFPPLSWELPKGENHVFEIFGFPGPS